MSEPGETTGLIGEGVGEQDPEKLGKAELGSYMWVIENIVSGIKGNRANMRDPLKSKDRNTLVLGCEVVQGWSICPDYIADLFSPNTILPSPRRSSYPFGSIRWAVDIAVHQAVAEQKDPGRAAKRRRLLKEYEFCRGRDIQDDDIHDSFTDATTSTSNEEGLSLTENDTSRTRTPVPRATDLLGNSSIRSLYETAGETQTLSNMSQSIRLNDKGEILISLRPDENDPGNEDMLFAQRRDGTSNFVQKVIANRHGLIPKGSDKVEGVVGFLIGERRIKRRVSFTVTLDSTQFGDIALGSKILDDLLCDPFLLATPMMNEAITPRSRHTRRSGTSSASVGSSESSSFDQGDRDFTKSAMEAFRELVRMRANLAQPADSGYSSVSSKSHEQSP